MYLGMYVIPTGIVCFLHDIIYLILKFWKFAKSLRSFPPYWQDIRLRCCEKQLPGEAKGASIKKHHAVWLWWFFSWEWFCWRGSPPLLQSLVMTLWPLYPEELPFPCLTYCPLSIFTVFTMWSPIVFPVLLQYLLLIWILLVIRLMFCLEFSISFALLCIYSFWKFHFLSRQFP